MTSPRDTVSAIAEVNCSGDTSSSNDSDSDVPLTKLMSKKQSEKSLAPSNNDTNGQDSASSDDDVPLAKLTPKHPTKQKLLDEHETVSLTNQSDDSNTEDNAGGFQSLKDNIFVNEKGKEMKNEKFVNGDNSSVEEDMPLIKLVPKKQIKKKGKVTSSSDEDVPPKQSKNLNVATSNNDTNDKDDSSSDEDVPLAKLKMTKQKEDKPVTASNKADEHVDDVPLSKFATIKQSAKANEEPKKTSNTDPNDKELNNSSSEKNVALTAKKKKEKRKTASKNDDSSGDDVPLTKVATKRSINNARKTTSKNGENEKDESSSEDDVPLSALVRRTQNEKSAEKKNSKMYEIEDDDSEDDVPLSKLTNKTQDKRQGVPFKIKKHSEKEISESDHSSDEPRIKKKTTAPVLNKSRQKKKTAEKCKGQKMKTERKEISITKKKPAAKTNKEKVLKSDSSDDEPLSEVMKKLIKQRTLPDKTCGSRRRAAQKRVKYAESSSEGSDNEQLKCPVKKKSPTAKRSAAKSKQSKYVESRDSSDDNEPLANLKRSKSPAKRKSSPAKRTPAKLKQSKFVESTESSDEDEPLAKLKTSKSSAKKMSSQAKRTPGKQSKYADSSNSSDDDEPLAKRRTSKSPAEKKSTPAKRTPAKSKEMLSSESSDDEPLINLMKKAGSETKPRTSSKKDTSFKEPMKTIVADDDSFIRVADHVELKKMIKVIVKRCHMKVNKATEEPTREDLQDSANSCDGE